MNQENEYIPALTGALIIATLSHAAVLPVWIIAWCCLMWGYLLASLRFGWPRPGRILRFALLIAGLSGLLLTYRTRPGPEAYLGLLAVMAALKPFESSTHRDRMITVFIAYFIIISRLLQSETFAVTLYMFFSVLVTTAALVRINDPSGDLRTGARRAGIIMGQAAPIMIVMFLLFPRLEGSIIGMQHTGKAAAGFSDRLSPGSISRLAKNDEPAFRAEFDGPVPSSHHLYWRGIVFAEFDGKTWQKQRRVPDLAEPVDGREPLGYTISLEPHNSRYLFALDLPKSAPSKRARLCTDFTVRSKLPVSRKRRYDMVSYTKYNARADGWGVEAASRLQKDANPRTRKLGKSLEQQSDTRKKIVEKGLEYLRNNDFVYTLEPPLLGKNSIDDFLFESKKGFCEHFASAFACLMRSAGVPARVVGGYLGGKINPFADYLIVRQSDAHAWVEVWYPDQGWNRVDPTLAAAPERLDLGIEAAYSDREKAGGFAGKYLNTFTSFIERAAMGWDAVSLRWEAFFYGYSREEQRAFLERIGIYWRSWKGPLAALGLALGITGGIVALYGLLHFKVPGPERKDPVKKQYQKFCKKLEKAGAPRLPHMGPKDFAASAANRFPSHRENINAITETYIRLRYRDEQDPEAFKRLRAMIRDFNPRRETESFNLPCI